jgi:hypothetical protein
MPRPRRADEAGDFEGVESTVKQLGLQSTLQPKRTTTRQKFALDLVKYS